MLIEGGQETRSPARAGLAFFRAQSPDYATLSALLFLTAAIGRPFSKLSIPGSSIYVTEVTLLAIAGLAVWRLGASGVVQRVGRRVPLVPLVLFWIVGGIAAVRGVVEWEVWRTLHDIALVEYSVLILVVAVVCDSRAQLVGLLRALAYGGATALVLFAASLAIPNSVSGIAPQPSFAVGAYVAFFAAAVASRAAYGLAVTRAEFAAAAAGVLAMFLTGQRSVWLAVLAGVIVLVALTPASQRRRIAVTSAAVFAVTAVVGITAVRIAPEQGAERIPTSAGERRQPLGLESDPTRSAQNIDWRLAYWDHAVDRLADAPVLGIGLGAPAAFTWDGHRYDHRTGGTGRRDWADVMGPHNSFLTLLMRIGILGIVPFLWLVFLALRGLARGMRQGTDAGDAAAALMAALSLVAVSTVASFHMALEGPFVGIFFWALIAIALLLGNADFAAEGAAPRARRQG